ncbi:transcriptional regulator, TetR family [Ammonifex degensii KC4]|uniref:Transcriptional regulator, TetR family n=1 Tax=Ammonifex degensii (strain DSM 10501 / KC4) TaxID=429009 RepID=C9RD01_AMMDK|nr:TetR/AcrR family transcriptional regulator [Ammonifex degensii]ACX52128.1 transcriptional regulator, TetR family [Ammonifex degensii KC4]
MSAKTDFLEQPAKTRILEAAEEVFAAKGFAGARVDEIAARARINKRMLYHYFGDKEKLYLSVLENNFARALKLTHQALEENSTPPEQAEQVITRYFLFLAEHPRYARLVTWEMLEGGNYARQILPPIWERGLSSLRSILERGMKEGYFRQDIDVDQLLITLHTLCIAYFTHKSMLAILWHGDPHSPENLKRRLDHILRLFRQYVTPHPEGGANA